MDLNQTKPKLRPRSKTNEKTLRGRPVWIDETGEVTGEKGTRYSEVSTTIPFGTGWITAPTIDESGNRLSDEKVKQRLKDNQGKDFITGEKLPVFSSEEKASEYAQWRSDTMFDKGAIEEGFPEETFPNLPEDKKEEKKESSTSFKGFIEYLFTPSRHFGTGQYSEGGLEAQTDNAFSKAISKRPGFRSLSDAKGQVSAEELKAGIDNAATYLLPFYESGVNISNVVEEYMKPESERDYDYIKQQFTDAGQSAAIEAGMILLGGVVFKYGGKGIKALYNKTKQYEVNPNAVSAFGVGAIRKKDTFEEVMTPVKATRKKVKQSGEAVLRPSADLASDLDPRLKRAMSADTAGSIMPGPGKFFNPSKPGYKGDKFVGMLKDADIELDLEFGNYIMMGKGKPKDVSNETFENLFISARPSEKKTSTSKAFDIKKQRKIKPGEANPNVQNKAVARANLYDGPSLSIEDMKANYLRNTNKPGVEVRTNLLQPGQFSMVTDEGKRALDHPIVAVQNMGGSNKKHFYTLDAQFVGPVRMDRLTKTDKKTGKVPQPNLRPVTVGDVQLGEQIGTIRIATKKTEKNPKGYNDHPLYDYIEVDASKSAPEDMGSIPKFNEGGVAMNEQMEMAFMQQGGIKDDGMNKDPVSGNPIPPGSMASEVRDDIPAMLSEGEYVVPADVLRFYGVNFFENLRGQAKSGLQNMEKNGRIGGEPLSQQQIQQNMGQSGVTMQANQGGAVGYYGGGGAIPDTYMDQAKALNPKPFDASQFSTVGGSTFSSNPQAEANSITRTETYINAETNDTRIVRFVSSGSETKIVPESDVQYTRPPYYLQGSSALKKAQQTVPTGGGGSDPKDPPETKPKQPFGTDVDWTDPKAYADSLLEGPDGLPKSVQMLSALAGPLGMAAVGGANAAMTLGKISDLRATQIIAQAQGDTTTSEYIDKELGKFIKRSPNIVSFLEKALAPGTSKAKEVLDRLGLDYEEDKEGNITFTERMQELNNRRITASQFDKDRSGGVYKPGGIDVALGQGSSSDKDYNAAVAKSRAAAAARRAAMEEAQAAGGSSDDIADLREKYEEAGGTWASGGRAEGGLMTKAKKKK